MFSSFLFYSVTLSILVLRLFALHFKRYGQDIRCSDKEERGRIFFNSNDKGIQNNATFVEFPSRVEKVSNIGLPDTLKKYYHKLFEHEAESIVAGLASYSISTNHSRLRSQLETYCN